jgi:hypothetical protein
MESNIAQNFTYEHRVDFCLITHPLVPGVMPAHDRKLHALSWAVNKLAANLLLVADLL